MFVIGYDIADAKRRNAVLRQLRRETACYQESFFELDLGPVDALALFQQLTGELVAGEDGLLMVPVWRPARGQGLPSVHGAGGSGIFLLG